MGVVTRILPVVLRQLSCAAVALVLSASGQTLAPVPQGGAAIPLVEPPAPLLPTSSTLSPDLAGANVPEDLPALPAVLREDGVSADAARALRDAGGKAGGWLRAYRFGDATGAYAAYTFFRQGARTVPTDKLSPEEAIAPNGEHLLLSGVTVLRSMGVPAAALRQVVSGLPKVSGRAGLAPLLPTYLPASGLDRASLHYTLGPAAYQAGEGVLPPGVIDWTKSTETATAGYTRHGEKGTLTLLLYPTPEIAGAQGRLIQKAINEAGAGRFGTVKLRRVGPLLALVTGGLSAAHAQELVAAVKLDQVVTFDQKKPLEFHAEVRKTASLLQNIALLSGLLVLAAVLLALFLGGARAGLRVLQGKPAASEPEFLTIDLRGKPKALAREKDDARNRT